MPKAQTTKHNLEVLSAGAHTAESFGRAVIASALAAAAGTETIVTGRPIKLQLDVSITPITGIGVRVCVGVPGFGTYCKIERDDRIE